MASFEMQLAYLKEQHPKARHFVTATRYQKEGQTFESFSDDKEPKGTAGKPLLNVLRGKELIDCAVIVVRYFGGVKLGTGGLVRAYTQALQESISKSTLLPYTPLKSYTIEVSYSHHQRIVYLLEKEAIVVEEKAFLEQSIVYTLSLSPKQWQKLETALKGYFKLL